MQEKEDPIGTLIHPDTLDFNYLRQHGIQKIEKLAGALWTDYNAHDPGITILEYLCFGLLDLNYRTTLPVEDVTSDPDHQLPTPEEALYCNPVTLNDLRRLLLDISGVKNARVVPDSGLEHEALSLKGRHKVLLELENDPGDFGTNKVTREIDDRVSIEVEFPMWDNDEIDWKDLQDVLDKVYSVTVYQEFGFQVYKNWLEVPQAFQYLIAKGNEGRSMVALYRDRAVQFRKNRAMGDLNDNRMIRQINDEEQRSIEVEFQPWEHVRADWDEIQLTSQIKQITVNERGKKDRFQWSELSPTYREEILDESGEGSMLSLYLEKAGRCHQIRDQVVETLHTHRNLCEDFAFIEGVRLEEIGFTADIEVEVETNTEDLLTEILYRINCFISPPVTFHHVLELLQQGVAVDKIFHGPALKHGVLLDEDLPVHREAIFVADIIHLVMGCKGVKAVKQFEMARYLKGDLHTGGNRWCVPLSTDKRYIPRLAPRKCYITFYKDGFPLTISIEQMIKAYWKRNICSRKRLTDLQESVSIPYPHHKERSLTAYHSLQNDFPLNYGIGLEGLPRETTALRRAQANQLKAYLVFFEQLMANYVSQLGHAKELFRMGEGSGKSFFYQLLDHIPNIDAVYNKDLVERQMKEDPEVYHRRKNLFLNHLLARLGVNIEDHAMLTSGMQGDKAEDLRQKAKLDLLQHGLTLNANRFTAYRYMGNQAVWDTDNVSGYKKRLCALLRINSVARKNFHGLSEGHEHEGFHLIEHILLVPRQYRDHQGGPLNPVRLRISEDKTSCRDTQEIEDPYSSMITMVLPDWIGRFSGSSFRHYFERTAYLESPAHIGIHFFWLNRDEMRAFEDVYKPWVHALADPAMAPEETSKKRNELVSQLNLLYNPEVLSRPENPVPDADQYALLSDHPDWEVPELERIQGHHWIIHTANTVLQNGYAGCNHPAKSGLGTIALHRQSWRDTSEALELTLVLDTHPYSEAGLAFLWKSRKDYWLFYYRNFYRKVVVAHVKDHHLKIVSENPIRDLKGKLVSLRMNKEHGRVRLRQTSPHTLGSEFLLNIPESDLSHTQFGLFTRYSNHTKFHRMELIDQKVSSLVPVRYIDASGTGAKPIDPGTDPNNSGGSSGAENVTPPIDTGKGPAANDPKPKADPGDEKASDAGKGASKPGTVEGVDPRILHRGKWPGGRGARTINWPDYPSIWQRLGGTDLSRFQKKKK